MEFEFAFSENRMLDGVELEGLESVEVNEESSQVNLKQTFVVFTERSGGTDDAGQAYVFGNVPLGFDFQRDLDAAYENYANVLNSKKWGYDISVGGDGLWHYPLDPKYMNFRFKMLC